MKELVIVSNDRFYKKKLDFYNSNKNTFTIISCFHHLKKVYLVARTSKEKLSFKKKFRNLVFLNFINFFCNINKIKKVKVLIVSLSPFNFLVGITLIIFGIKKENLYLFLRSDGFHEYEIKFGKIGKLIYGLMFFLIKKRLKILSCSNSLTGTKNSKLIYPSEITNEWIKNRKKQFRKLDLKKKIKLLYLGRFRKEKGFIDLIKLLSKVKIKYELTMVGNDFKTFKKKDYPKNKKINIIGQISTNKKLIKYYNNSDIFILPSYSEAFPQVILESFSRLKPVIIFKEIYYLKKMFSYGIFISQRNTVSLEKTIKRIAKDYSKIQLKIFQNKVYSLKDFSLEMNKIINVDFIE